MDKVLLKFHVDIGLLVGYFWVMFSTFHLRKKIILLNRMPLVCIKMFFFNNLLFFLDLDFFLKSYYEEPPYENEIFVNQIAA